MKEIEHQVVITEWQTKRIVPLGYVMFAALVLLGGSRLRGAPQDKPEPALQPAAGKIHFDFETGDLQGWRVVEGGFVRVVTDRTEYHNKGPYASRQGKFHLSTVEGVNSSSADPQRGVIESPVFLLEGP
ncbi:MAG: hypothetical protein K9N23_20800, partial [Akkermansiaceae bacterium]|nr:hypothetical protein [Akkermansiaceae bacterium]